MLAVAAEAVQEFLDNQPAPLSQAAYLAYPHHQALWQAWQEKRKER